MEKVFIKATATASWYQEGEIYEVEPMKIGRYYNPRGNHDRYIREDECVLVDTLQSVETVPKQIADKLAEALEWVYNECQHGIPIYAFGDSEGGVALSHVIDTIAGGVASALESYKKSNP